MDTYDVRRLALIFAVQAEIDGMNTTNYTSINTDGVIYWDENHFKEKAEELRNLAASHNEQL